MVRYAVQITTTQGVVKPRRFFELADGDQGDQLDQILIALRPVRDVRIITITVGDKT